MSLHQASSYWSPQQRLIFRDPGSRSSVALVHNVPQKLWLLCSRTFGKNWQQSLPPEDYLLLLDSHWGINVGGYDESMLCVCIVKRKTHCVVQLVNTSKTLWKTQCACQNTFLITMFIPIEYCCYQLWSEKLPFAVGRVTLELITVWEKVTPGCSAIMGHQDTPRPPKLRE